MKPTYEELAVQLANAESKCRELAAENGHARERHVFIRALAVSSIVAAVWTGVARWRTQPTYSKLWIPCMQKNQLPTLSWLKYGPANLIVWLALLKQCWSSSLISSAHLICMRLLAGKWFSSRLPIVPPNFAKESRYEHCRRFASDR